MNPTIRMSKLIRERRKWKHVPRYVEDSRLTRAEPIRVFVKWEKVPR